MSDLKLGRWMEVVKRHTNGISNASKQTSTDSPYGRRRSLVLNGLNTASDSSTYLHHRARCFSVGNCSVSRILDQCMLQGGLHHTQMCILSYLGMPLRADTCCYLLNVQWYRTLGKSEDFQMIQDAHNEWFTPTADDIGARILAKVMIQDEDAVRTKLLEYGPIKEDPNVRSKVEMYLERRSGLFMGLKSVYIQDQEQYHIHHHIQESWTLLMDDRRVRVTCESALLTPFESFYTSSIRIEIIRSSPIDFRIYFLDNCFIQLQAESNAIRDIIVLTLRAFCRSSVSSELINDAIAKGISPMLTIRTIAAMEQSPTKAQLAYNLPWTRPNTCSGALLIDEDEDEDSEASYSDEDGRKSCDSSITGSTSLSPCTEILNDHHNRSPRIEELIDESDMDDTVLQDADSLIGHALTLGLPSQVHTRAPKRISVTEIPDLHIIEVHEDNNTSTHPISVSLDEEDSMNDAIASFQTCGDSLETLRNRYVSIFCTLQRALSENKVKTGQLQDRLSQTMEENTCFKNDIAMLQSTLTSIQIARHVKEMVTNDLRQLERAKHSIKLVPHNFY